MQPYFKDGGNILSSSEKYESVTPADTDLLFLTREIRVGGAGDLSLLLVDDTTVVIQSCQVGEHLAVVAKQVKAATTATKITVFY